MGGGEETRRPLRACDEGGEDMVGDEGMGGEVWGRVVQLWMQSIDRGMRCSQASVSRRGC